MGIRETFSWRCRLATSCLAACMLGSNPAAAQVPQANSTHDTERRAFIAATYTTSEVLIPMRDGKQLHTTIFMPKDADRVAYPIILGRSPYGNDDLKPDSKGAFLYPANVRNEWLHDDNYIFVFQDVRGMFGSANDDFEDLPTMHTFFPGSARTTDESTDAYDTIDWLVKNVRPNNGKVCLFGVSYRGTYAISGLLSRHPAIAAAVIQAPVDSYDGDVYRNGCFMLMQDWFWYNTFLPFSQTTPTKQFYPEYTQANDQAYEFFLSGGNLQQLTAASRLKNNRFWNVLFDHPSNDEYWKKRNTFQHFRKLDRLPPVLLVGGWYDIDLLGTLRAYAAFQGKSEDLHLQVGPWWHGAWNRNQFQPRRGDSLGSEFFGHQMADEYQEKVELPFIRHYLKGSPKPNLPPVKFFSTGANSWLTADAWPAVGEQLVLYPHRNGVLDPHPSTRGSLTFKSDPNQPVPYGKDLTIEGDDAAMVADQSFASRRKDVLVFTSDPLPGDLAIAGNPVAKLTVSVTGTDSDWVAKLVDVSPDGKMQRLVRADVLRARYRDGLDSPKPMKPGRTYSLEIRLLDVAHTFRKGHRIMLQIQSSLFPCIDRNPQKFVPIHSAQDTDFHPEKHTLHFGGKTATCIILPVLTGSQSSSF